MFEQKKFIVSHAPFWHNGSSVAERNYNIIVAALPAALFGLTQYGAQAPAVLCLSVSSAMIWELIANRATKRPETLGDGNAALIGLLFGMLLPAASPWWLVITGTFVAVIVGKQIFGGIGGNPFNPALIGYGILLISWPNRFDFNAALVNFEFGFDTAFPLWVAKYFGTAELDTFTAWNLLSGQQIGGIGSTFGLGLIAGGIYLIVRGFIRWEISLSYLAGIFVTAFLFNIANPDQYAGPFFHMFTGFTLLAAFFLATDDASSPVNFIPMLIYGAGCGMLTILIRNIGVYVEGTAFAIIVMNCANPLLDRIRPKAVGKVV
ncbi:Electron transport complex protein RnfD [Olavius algarvensis associated proteobacterium Delta 3]|nr:Electron transport complex protein RnfD [Olavius algarvensis associated proteobacterium Delta 3]